MNSGSSLAYQGVSRRFGSVVALHDFTLKIGSGELVTLLGPSGCGKTTALRIAAGFDVSDTGSLLLDDQEVSRVPASGRGMGMVFQNYSLFPHLTVEGNIAFGLKIKGFDKERIQEIVAAMLERVRLSGLGGRYPHQLSGGQQQRVALARALAIEPKVLLLDEPLSALDAKVRAELRSEIRQLQTETGVSTLFVTHDQDEAMAISDRIVVMDKGIIQQIGSPVDVYMSPTNAFVARFIGAMNELPARVVDSQTVELFGNFFSAIAGMDVGHVVLLVRPDAVRVTPPGVTGTIAAKVIEVVFSGSASVLRLMVDHQGHQTQLDSVVWSRDLQHTPGDRVGIEIELNRAVFEHR